MSKLREGSYEVCAHTCNQGDCISRATQTILWKQEKSSATRHAKNMNVHLRCTLECPANPSHKSPTYVRPPTDQELQLSGFVTSNSPSFAAQVVDDVGMSASSPPQPREIPQAIVNVALPQPFQKDLLSRIRSISTIFGVGYLILVLLLTIPFFQAHVLYSHAFRLPLFAKFDQPEKYGLAPGKTLNLKLYTSDNVSIGAWFVLSDTFYHTLPSIPSPETLELQVSSALKTHPTILFFHGNAATRAFRVRIQHYSAFSSRLGANVLAIDYRGFGESEGKPDEIGLARDARAAWDWLISQGARAEDVLIVGHSLGTAVATKLGAELGGENVPCRGVVLMSPFSSIKALLDTYSFFGLIPLIKPLAMIPGALNLINRSIVHKFDTLIALQNIKASLLIAHAEDDWDIPYGHSQVLFNTLLEPFLPASPTVPIDATSWGTAEWQEFNAGLLKRTERRKEVVASSTIHNFGSLEEFSADGRKVVLLKTLAGGHDRLGVQEGVHDVMRYVFDL